jgi:zinc and cadmium transporter
VWSQTLLSVALVSAVPLAIAVLLPPNEASLRRIVPLLVAFAAGALLGAAFLHMLPESLAAGGRGARHGAIVLTGFFGFFILEQYLWSHEHASWRASRLHLSPLALLNVVGDGIHNMVDGMVIAAAYLTDTSLGVATTLAVLLHEVPQEIGDLGILLHTGLSRRRAIAWNMASALSAFVGAVGVLVVGARVTQLATVLVPFAAGGFIYIAASDLVPQLREESVDGRRTSALMVALALGVGLVALPLLLG